MAPRIATRLLAVMGQMIESGEDCATVARLAELTGLTGAQVSDACQVLRRNGLARHVRHQCYTLTEAGLKAAREQAVIFRGPRTAIGPTRPRRDSLIQRTWRAMRIMRKFDLAQLTVMASRDERQARQDITKYAHALVQTGYLALIKAQGSTRGRQGASQRYLLLRDTGPHAPRWRKPQREVFDPNTGKTWAIPAKEVAA